MKYIKEFNNFIIEEVGVKFSKTIFEKIHELVTSDIECAKNNKKDINSTLNNINIECNLTEFLYDKPIIKLGAWLVYHLLNKDYNTLLENKLNKILEDRNFEDLEIGNIKTILKYNPYYKEDDNYAATLFYRQEYNNLYDVMNSFRIEINIHELIENSVEKTSIEHELIHLTQKVNGFCLSIGEKLLKCDDINKEIIEDILKTSWDIEKLFGGPKTKTYAISGEWKHKKMKMLDRDKNLDPNIVTYLLDDTEYQNWINDKVNKIVDDFINLGLKQKKDIIGGLKKYDDKKRAEELDKIVIDISKYILGGEVKYSDGIKLEEADNYIKFIRPYRKEVDKDVMKSIRKKLENMIK